ncbi:MAG TPA: hypothetical protein VFE63_01770 [Roseiarcus sp.]|jgi:hypothetical protein|nr:hypothetical protein [Roseiarcus sp.]
MKEQNGARLGGRVLLALLTLYALAMIAPDFARLVRPLASFGMAVNADGLIYDLQSPFADEAESPAWRAGLRIGDRLDLARMRCIPVDTEVCASNLALWGGVTFVMPGREATLVVAPRSDRPAREVKLVAEPRRRSLALDAVLLIQQVAGVLVVLGAAYLVWIRPGPMTWGFFAYTIYFNPGQAFFFFAWLQQWPWALLAQNAAACILQAAGYTGLLLFSLRAPVDRAEGPWRRIEQALPALAFLFLAVALASLGSAFGYPTELAFEASILLGFAVSAAALAILLGRRKHLSPRDCQRMRWVIWGCLIGLPAYLIAEISMETSLPASLFGEGAVTEDVTGLFYLVNGILCLFVVEAVRRPTVVSVWVPLRRASLLGLLLSLPAFFVHEELNTINEWTQLPEWAWVLAASALIFLISRAHEWLTELADRLFDRSFRRAEARLAAVGRTIQRAVSLDEIDRLLVDEPSRSLRLASAALFREEDGVFRRRVSAGWAKTDADRLLRVEPPLAGRLDDGPFRLDGRGTDLPDVRLPTDLGRPVLGVPVGNPRRCYAVLLYGGHEEGTDLDEAERELLARLAREAEISYGEVESETLRNRIDVLQSELARVSAARESRARMGRPS